MTEFKVRQIVQCSRLGKGDFKIIDIRGSDDSREARIQSIDNPKEIHWIYVAHLSTNAKTRRMNINNRHEEANKILTKPRQKNK